MLCQILAFLLLIPLTAILILIFNIYLINAFYLIFLALFAVAYALACTCLFKVSIYWFFIPLTVFYVVRMQSILKQSQVENNKFPTLRAKMKGSELPFSMKLLIPLSCLSWLKLLPNSVSRELLKQREIEFDLPQLIDFVIDHSRNAKIEIMTDEAQIYFEIK